MLFNYGYTRTGKIPFLVEVKERDESETSTFRSFMAIVAPDHFKGVFIRKYSVKPTIQELIVEYYTSKKNDGYSTVFGIVLNFDEVTIKKGLLIIPTRSRIATHSFSDIETKKTTIKK